MNSVLALLITTVLLSGTSAWLSQSLLSFCFWFVIWFLLLNIGCYVSAKIYSFLLRTLGYKFNLKDIFAVYGGAFWRLLPFLAVQSLLEIFADHIWTGQLIANIFLMINLILYIFWLTGYLPANLPKIIKGLLVVCSLIPQLGVFYLVIR